MRSHFAATVAPSAHKLADRIKNGTKTRDSSTPAEVPIDSSARNTKAPRATDSVVGSRMRRSSIAARAAMSPLEGSVVLDGSVSSATRGSSRAGRPSHEVPSALASGGEESTPTRLLSPSRVPARRMAPLPRNVPLPTSIGVTSILPSRARVPAKTTSSATKLASPKLTRRFSPTAVETSVRLPSLTPRRRNHERVKTLE